MNIKALPSVGSAFFVAFVLWSRRFAVPLQKESLGGALGGAPTEQEVRQQSYVGALETSAPPEGTTEGTTEGS